MQTQTTGSWYSAPEAAKNLLQLVTRHWEKTETATAFMHQALVLAGDNPEVLVSAYRYFFYKHESVLALQMALRLLEQLRQLEHLPTDWEDLQPILVRRQEEPVIRLYLNAYSASSLLLAQMGEHTQAREVIERVQAVNPKNDFGAALVLKILDRSPDEEEE